MPADRWATFDCYGTLVDWFGGTRSTIAELWPDADAAVLLERYLAIEPVVQEGRGIPYRTVLAEALTKLAAEQELDLPPDRRAALPSKLRRTSWLRYHGYSRVQCLPVQPGCCV